MPLSREEEDEIRNLLAKDGSLSIDFELGQALVPETERRAIERDLIGQMATEGKVLDERPGVQNYWGGELARRYADNVRGSLNARLTAVLSKSQSEICGRYCAVKADGTLDGEAFKVAVAIADILISAAVWLPIPATRLSVYLARTRLLDRMCVCPPGNA